MYRIILDAMGGDHAPGEIVAGARAALEEFEDLELHLVGKQEAILPLLEGCAHLNRVHITDAREEIEMAESPVKAIRTKKDSSMVVGMKLAAAGEGDVFITAGSTGAAIAGATLIVRRAKGVERPALAPLLPTVSGKRVMIIDCGANVDCKPSQLRQFGIMGSIYAQTLMGVENPRVGLLNNGAEEEKGNALTKAAYQLLQETDLNFVGNVEGRHVMMDRCDVLVCDGFAGNVLMKSLEGMAGVMMKMLKEELYASMRCKLGAALAMPAFRSMKKKMDYKEYGGALMLGVQAGVIKAHGSSSARSIKNSIAQARAFAEAGVVAQITEKLAAYAAQEKTS